MFKKVILLVMIVGFSCALNAMQQDKNALQATQKAVGKIKKKAKGKNWISKELHYTLDALNSMEKYTITAEEVVHVLKTGVRTWEQEKYNAQRFIERNNKVNPLIVLLNRTVKPNVVVKVSR